MAGPIPDRTDVCVIGGGPAGAVIALELARFGHAVCLVDAALERTRHPAATLPGGLMSMLEYLGVMDRVVDASFAAAKEIVRWWDEPAPRSAQLAEQGLHVDRAIFDRLLLTGATDAGVHVVQPARALRAERLDAGGWRVRIRHDRSDHDVRCLVIVDATGGRGVIPARRRRHPSMLVALWASWIANTDRCPEGRLEAGDDEWFWCAPYRPGRLMVSVFIDPRRLGGGGRANATDLYLRLIERFQLLPRRATRRRVGRVEVSDAAMRWAVDAAGADFVRVGDASVRLDPLSSQGVQAAIASGLQGAVVANTLVARRQAHGLAVSFYCDRQLEHLRRHAVRTAGFYRAVAKTSRRTFWQQLSRPAIEANPIRPIETSPLDVERKLRMASDVRLEPGSILRGRFVEPANVLRHTTLERPIAFLGNVEIASLLSDFTPPVNAHTAAQRWSSHMPQQQAWDTLQWLWQHRIIVC